MLKIFPILLLVIFSCAPKKKEKNPLIAHCDGESIEIALKPQGKNALTLYPEKDELDSKKAWKIDYPVYHWEIADVDNDGCDEILVGVTKTTRFDPNPGKRLFIFKLFDGHIRPKWMGSRLSKPLVTFKAIGHDKTFILSLEEDGENEFLIAYYEYGEFGLEFVSYLHRKLSENSAKLLFQFY